MTAATHGLDHEPSSEPATQCSDGARASTSMPAVPTVPAEVVAAYRSSAGALGQRITGRICSEVAAFSDPVLSTVVAKAINGAVRLFVDHVAGAPTRPEPVFDYYRWLGRAEARAGHDLDGMRAAHHIAMEETLLELEVVMTDFDLPFSTYQQLSHALIDYQRRLHDRAVTGHSTAEGSRGQMLTALLEGAPAERLRQLAPPSWQVPDTVAVAASAATEAATKAVASMTGVLAGVRQKRLIVVADADLIDQVGLCIARRARVPVAVSWGVAPHEVPHALRWATRALRLARQGEIAVPPSHLVRCRDHGFALWQHADPVLSRQLTAAVLAPLLAEKPSRREALGETMLLWLQTRASAPALAAQLGVHDQTVRHRLKRIRAMFGDVLDEPDRASELVRALQAFRGTSHR